MLSPLQERLKRHVSISYVDLAESYGTSGSYRIFFVKAQALKVPEAMTSNLDFIVAILILSLMRTFNYFTKSTEITSAINCLAY